MLYVSANHSTPIHIQGSYVSDDELDWAISIVKDSTHDLNNKFVIPEVDIPETQSDNSFSLAIPDIVIDDSKNKELAAIIMWTLSQKTMSAKKLTENFQMGNRASDIIDKLCNMGIVSEKNFNQPRNVLPTSINDISDEALKLLSKYGFTEEKISEAISNHLQQE